MLHKYELCSRYRSVFFSERKLILFSENLIKIMAVKTSHTHHVKKADGSKGKLANYK